MSETIDTGDESGEEVEYEPEEFTIASKKFIVTTVAYLPIQTLMKNREKNVEISGQALWCGSLCVIHYLLNHSSIARNAIVVEMGAGTGIMGMCCQRLAAARKVFLTDHDAVSLAHMEADIQRNALEDLHVLRLDWLAPGVSIEQLQALVQTIDGNPSRIMVVAGDVVYKHMLLGPFFATMENLLELSHPTTAEPSVAYLCHVPRAGVTHELVIEAAKGKNLCIEEVDIMDVCSDSGSGSSAILGCEASSETCCLRYCPKEELDRAKLYKITRCI